VDKIFVILYCFVVTVVPQTMNVYLCFWYVLSCWY